MSRYRVTALKDLPEPELADALARTPADHYVIWNGRPCPMQPGSIRSQALALVDTAWIPVPLRAVQRQAARLCGQSGLDPDTVRSAVRMHQSAGHASYFLVRRTLSGDYVAVTDVPYPSSGSRRLRAGELVLSRSGERFDSESDREPALRRA